MKKLTALFCFMATVSTGLNALAASDANIQLQDIYCNFLLDSQVPGQAPMDTSGITVGEKDQNGVVKSLSVSPLLGLPILSWRDPKTGKDGNEAEETFSKISVSSAGTGEDQAYTITAENYRGSQIRIVSLSAYAAANLYYTPGKDVKESPDKTEVEKTPNGLYCIVTTK